MRNILIIKCGSTHDDIKENFGDFEDWIIEQSNLPTKVFKINNVSEGDRLHHPSEYIAAIITGSHANVNQHLPWIKYLKDWIITAKYSNIPVLGICFGHQIIAEALGGKVILNPDTLSIGAKLIKLTEAGIKDPLFKKTGASFESYKLNSFYVSKLPLGAELLAMNNASEIESFKVDKIYGVQFHPEINSKIMALYIKKTKTPDKIRAKIKIEYKNQSIIPNFLDQMLKI